MQRPQRRLVGGALLSELVLSGRVGASPGNGSSLSDRVVVFEVPRPQEPLLRGALEIIGERRLRPDLLVEQLGSFALPFVQWRLEQLGLSRRRSSGLFGLFRSGAAARHLSKIRHDVARVIADGDLVALHGSYPGLADDLLLGFDIYRVVDGKIVEHWDGLVEQAEPNPSGRTQLDGTAEPDPSVDTEESRKTVLAFFEEVLIGQNYDAIPQHTNGEDFIQHASDIADGAGNMRDFLAKLKEDGTPLVYDTIHRTVAQNDFVLTHSEGSIDGERHSFCELWRVADGKVVELWDAIGPLPADADMAHPHGAF